MVPNRTCNSVT